MNNQNLFIGLDGIKISLSNIEEIDFNYQFLSDSGYTLKGYKKWFLKNGEKDIAVFYNPDLKILKIEGNPLYYYQGHNFTGDIDIYLNSIIKISEDLGVNLFIGIVEYFEFGVICLIPHGTKSTIAAHSSGKGLIKSEITKNGYLAYFESKLIDIKLYDASRNIQNKQNRSMKSLIQKLGWNKNENFIKIEVVYKKPEILSNNIELTFEEIIQLDFIESLKQNFLQQYNRLEVSKCIDIAPTEKSISTPVILLYYISQKLLDLNMNINLKDDILNSINNIPDSILSRGNKGARKHQIRKMCSKISESNIVNKFDLTEIIKDNLKLNNLNE